MQVELAHPGARTSNGILNAKLHPPEPRPEWIERTELVGRLIDGRDRRLVLVTAPAGYGKSTLISQWHDDVRENRTFAYVALDRRDNEPAAMWTAILNAADRTDPDLELDDLITSLQAHQLESTIVPTLLDRLGGLGQPMVIVLDDFHAIREPACHEQITLLLRYLPAGCQLVLASRTVPPVGVGRLRACGDLVEVGTQDLRLTGEETSTFVREVSQYPLTERDIATVVDQTEGWPAGAYLAALSLRTHGSPDRYILDYLSEEVLAELPEQTRRFLLRTSILERLTAPLCAAVAGTTNAGQVLEDLERANLFLIPLDSGGGWYRYHHLVATFLRAQLALAEPGTEASLHEAACDWLVGAGLFEDAIEHAFAAGRTDRVITLVTGHWPRFAGAGHSATVQAWLERLGDGPVSHDPAAAICAAWQAAFARDRHAVRRWLAIAESLEHTGPLPDGSRSVASAAALIRASSGFDGLDETLRSAQVAAELESEPDSAWYSVARTALGYSRYLAGSSGEAIEPLEQAAQSPAAPPAVRVLALSALSLATGRLGRHAAARDLATVAHDLVRSHALADPAAMSLALTARGAVSAADGDLDTASEQLAYSLRLQRRVRGMPAWPVLDNLVLLAGVAHARGDPTTARELSGEAADLLAGMPGSDGRVRADLDTIGRRLAGNGTPAGASLPLTKRELTVLHLLQGTLSVTAIAAELFLSANTVKTHTRMIYQKLEVSSRHQAVARARALGLL